MLPSIAVARPLIIGAKRGAESQIIAEMLSLILADNQIESDLKLNLSGTQISFGALRSGAIDLYVDYSGTIDRIILKKDGGLIFHERATLLSDRYNIKVFPSLGFQNSYAVAIRSDFSRRHAIRRISDLKSFSEKKVVYGFDHEFIRRDDGFVGLNRAYNLLSEDEVGSRLVAMDHDLSYSALRRKSVDVMDIYSTDAKLLAGDIVLLEDDLNCFPDYRAMPLVRNDAIEAHPQLALQLSMLVGRIDEASMIKMNAEVEISKVSPRVVALDFLLKQGLIARKHSTQDFVGDRSQRRSALPISLQDMVKHGARHLLLSVSSVFFAIVIAVPLGIYIYHRPRLSRITLGIAGVLQTVPSLALLAILLVILGIGWLPAVVALIIYALYPIINNTMIAMRGIDPQLLEVASGLGLSKWQLLRHIQLPLALPVVFAGIRTATMISVGTTTLAAFIGGGGFGVPIITGLSTSDMGLILSGAIPAALLAIGLDLVVAALSNSLTSPGIRYRE